MGWRRVGIAVAAALLAAGFAALGFRQNRPVKIAPPQNISMQEIKLTSAAFENGGMIPARFTCDGDGVSPPLVVGETPAETKSLALVLHDPDAPVAGGWTHWVRFNIPVDRNVERVESYKVASLKLEEGEEPEGTRGKGTSGNLTYVGPCPPSGRHRYIFSVYALDAMLALRAGATKTELESAMAGHTLGRGELVGLYSKQ